MATLCQESIAVDLSSVDTNLNLQKASEDFQWRSIDSVLKTVLGRLNSASLTTDYCTVSGKSMGDIPSSYQIPALRHHERAVVGTYVHPDIVPGFKYCARANGTDEYIFDRQPMLLENIGQQLATKPL